MDVIRGKNRVKTTGIKSDTGPLVAVFEGCRKFTVNISACFCDCFAFLDFKIDCKIDSGEYLMTIQVKDTGEKIKAFPTWVN